MRRLTCSTPLAVVVALLLPFCNVAATAIAAAQNTDHEATAARQPVTAKIAGLMKYFEWMQPTIPIYFVVNEYGVASDDAEEEEQEIVAQYLCTHLRREMQLLTFEVR